MDEIGRRMGHTRGYMSRALRGLNPLTLETIFESLEIAGVEPVEYFTEVAKALTLPEREDEGSARIRSRRPCCGRCGDSVG